MLNTETLKICSSSERGHVLLVSPLTFSYHESISETLSALGYAVTWWNDRASASTWYKIALRLFPSITRRLSERVFLKQLSKIDPQSISHVLVIKGEGLTRRITLKLRNTFKAASMGYYLWDGIDNVRQAFDILPAFDSIATFDPRDAEKYGWIYRPLFWRNVSIFSDPSGCSLYDWCFIGTIHSDRHKVIHRLRERYKNQLRCYVYCYFQSPLMLLFRRLLDRTLWSVPAGSLSTKPMHAMDVARIVASSRAVLDVEHPHQHGFTMRTIETLLSGKKLITTNSSILTSDLYHPSRILIIKRDQPEISVQFLDEEFLGVDEDLRKYYSCDGWATELLALQDSARWNSLKADSRN